MKQFLFDMFIVFWLLTIMALFGYALREVLHNQMYWFN